MERFIKMIPNNKKHTEKSLKQGAGFSDNFISSSYNISKSGKAMMVDEMLIGVQESRDKYVKDLQQENARLKEENFYLNEKCLSYFKALGNEKQIMKGKDLLKFAGCLNKKALKGGTKMKAKRDVSREEDLFRFAVYFNNEYIGEAISFKVIKGNSLKGIMNMLEIKGDYQAKK